MSPSTSSALPLRPSIDVNPCEILYLCACHLLTQTRAASTLVLGEHDGAAVTAATLSTVTAAAKLGPVTVLLTGR